MSFETPKPSDSALETEKNPELDNARLEFTNSLDEIKKKQVTIDTIDTYSDDVINELIAFTQRVVSAYSNELGLPLVGGKEFEDRAFEHYGLPDISKLLDMAYQKGEELSEVSLYISKNIKYLDGVIVPPDENPRIISGSGEGLEDVYFTPRLKIVLYLLVDSGISLENIQTFEGKLNSDMLRSKSYITIVVPEIDRIIQVCDEDGNASYVFKLSEMKIEDANNMSKQAKLDWIEKNPDKGVRIINRSNWRDRIESALFGDFSVEAEKKIPDGVLVIEKGEIDEWRGFAVDPETGKHWGTRDALVKKLGRSQVIFKKRIKDERLQTKLILNRLDQVQDGYCYEDFISLFPELMMGNKVDREGDWRGFWTDKETGKHWGSGNALMKKLDVNDWVTVKKYIKRGNYSSIDIQDAGGRLTKGYCYEDFLNDESFLEFKTAPEVNREGEWRGYYVEGDKHWASLNVLAERFLSTNTTLKAFAERFGFSSKNVKTIGKEINPAYCLEDFLSNQDFIKFVNLPISEKGGEWQGFLIKDGQHFGTIFRISQKLGRSRESVSKVLAEDLEVPFVAMKDSRGKPFTGYSIEYVQGKL